MVSASRRHLTERYASGVDLLLWETEKRLIPDLDAIKSVTAAAAAGQAEGLDMGAALVLVQAARLALDRLEGELFEAAHAMGMPSEAIAAVLDLPNAVAADKRQSWLEGRRALPYASAESQRPETGRAARRAEAAHRAKTAAAPPTARRPGTEHAAQAADDDTSEQQP